MRQAACLKRAADGGKEGGCEKDGEKEKKIEIVVASSHKHGPFSHSAIPPPGPELCGRLGATP